ncbi:hypothetical protein ASG90_04805 [Nocardioides sp. Soil797]|nr:hypothetical protein ASG90_04805 [Nocardioides sp. Soil797]
MSRSSRNDLKKAKWWFVGICCLSSVVWIILLFSSNSAFELHDDDPVADVTVHTPYVDRVATALREDPVFIDPVLADTVGREVDTATVRSRIELTDTDVFLLALPTHGVDPDRDEVLLARIAEATDREGVYLAYDENGRASYLVHGLGDVEIHLYPAYDGVSEANVVALVDAVDSEVAERQKEERSEDWTENPLLMGLFMGITFAVPLWYLMKFVRWSSRRDKSYLKGFKQ